MKTPLYLGDVSASDSTWWAVYDGAAARSHGEQLCVIATCEEEPEPQTLGGLSGATFHGGGPEGRYLVWQLEDGLALIEDQALFIDDTHDGPAAPAVATAIAEMERPDPELWCKVEVTSGAVLLWSVYELDVDDLSAGSETPASAPDKRWLWIPLENGTYELSLTAPELQHPSGVEIDEVLWLTRKK